MLKKSQMDTCKFFDGREVKNGINNYLFDCREIEPTDEALSMGLINLIYPPKHLHEKVQAYAESLAQKPFKALAAIRRTNTEGGACHLMVV